MYAFRDLLPLVNPSIGHTYCIGSPFPFPRMIDVSTSTDKKPLSLFQDANFLHQIYTS